MAQWGKTDTSSNSVSWGAASLNKGSGRTAQASNNTGLYNNVTVGAIKSNQVVGQFGASSAEMANTGKEGRKVQAVGWQLRRAGMGPILTLTATGGTSFANGESILLSGGTVNATANLTTNSAQNLIAATVNSNNGGTFANTSAVTVTFRREKHMVDIKVTGGTGYSNTDTIRSGNGTIAAVATLTTNAAGTFGNTDIVLTNVGLFANTKANVDVSFTVLAANGATSNGSGATLTANIGTSATGTVTAATLGGRAGRVHYECLVSMASLSNGATDDSYLPS